MKKQENKTRLPGPAGRFVFLGSSSFSTFVLEALKTKGWEPVFSITSAKEPLPIEKLKEINADVFVVASFGKILPDELIYMPPHKTLNVHPSLLPKLRGASPIQSAILNETETGVTIMRLDEQMDHGPILAQKKVDFNKWPVKYTEAEQKLGTEGGLLLADILEKWIKGEVEEIVQDESQATYIKKVTKENGLIDFKDSTDKNLRKICAFEKWPGAYFFFTKRNGQQIRVVVKEAEIINGELYFLRVVPEGKREMLWEDFLKGNG